MEILDQWRSKVAQAEAEAGLALADQMLGLQGQVELPTLQRAYAEVLLELLARTPNVATAQGAAQRPGAGRGRRRTILNRPGGNSGFADPRNPGLWRQPSPATRPRKGTGSAQPEAFAT